MDDNKHRPFREVQKGKPVFWRTETRTSKWLKLVRSATRQLTPREPWRLKQQED